MRTGGVVGISLVGISAVIAIDLGRLNVTEVAIHEWANGKVEHEKFVY
jgi:hypothetical protein